MTTAMYSCLHFLVDGLCAWAMFGRFLGGAGGFEAMLIYNFCAFALQLPLGILVDALGGKRTPAYTACLGAALTLLGVRSGPAVLGLGNALFHVGGGIGTIREDFRENRHGALLGVFVAPGALGLYLGGQAAGNGAVEMLWILAAGVVMALVLHGCRHLAPAAPEPVKANGFALAAMCFLVVILRSHVGMAAGFPWKQGFWMGLLAVLAVVLGKMAGGILAAKFGMTAVTAASLSLAAVGFLRSEMPAFGLLALLCFNMTMPLTLYALVRRFPENPGAVFGLLTFGLFLGFLPTAYGWGIPAAGSIACIISLGVLIAVGRMVDRHDRLCGVAGSDAGV